MAREQRRLAAIFSADVVGYSRLMGRDESGTLVRLREHRNLRLEPTLARHGGRLVKLTGDGVLVEFPSAVDALGAAIEFQQAMADANRDQPGDAAIVFRVGLHLGDLIVDGDDLYGDGVNVAARLEAEAPPGGIVISGNMHDAVAGRLNATFDELGKLDLKNIERPVLAFRIGWHSADWRLPDDESRDEAHPPGGAPSIPSDKPSIAVRPFTVLSESKGLEFLADGLAEDVIALLARVPGFFLISRASSFAFRNPDVPLAVISRQLGVRYVVEGSVREAGDRIRVSAQLSEAMIGRVLWSGKFEVARSETFDPHVQSLRTPCGREVPGLLEHYDLLGLSWSEAMERAARRNAPLEVYPRYPAAVIARQILATMPLGMPSPVLTGTPRPKFLTNVRNTESAHWKS